MQSKPTFDRLAMVSFVFFEMPDYRLTRPQRHEKLRVDYSTYTLRMSSMEI